MRRVVGNIYYQAVRLLLEVQYLYGINTIHTKQHCNISSILPPTPYVLSHQDYPTYTVSQTGMRHHLFTIILDTPDHYWPITHIALTYSDIYDDISNVYILFCLILFAPHLCHDPATPLHYDDIIIAIDTALSALLLVHIIGITVPHYSRHRVPLV